MPCHRLTPTCSRLAGVEAERPGKGELSELVADHGLGDVDRHVLAAVVDGDGVADHVGDDRGAARPRLDDALLVLGVEVVDLLQQVLVDERTLLEAPGHALPPSAARAPAPDDQLLGRLVLLAGAALGLAPRAHRMATPRGLSLAAAGGVVDGVHGHAARLGAHALPAVAALLAEGHELDIRVA